MKDKAAKQSTESSKTPVPCYLTPERIEELCEAVEARRRNVTTLIQQVISGVKVAACFFGPGGHGKSWAVKQELDNLTGKAWVHHKGVMTPRALYDNMYNHRDHLHVFEDMEPILKNPAYSDILRPALDDGDEERVVKWEIKGEEASFVFRGGVIIVGNEDLSKSRSPIGEAVKSRIKPVCWQLSVPEIMAVMKRMANAGYSRRGNVLNAKQCHEVADYLIHLMSSGQAMNGIDLRFFASHALPARVDSEIRSLGKEWQTVIVSMLESTSQEIESRESRADRLEKIALQIQMAKLTKPEKAQRWTEMTGLKVAQFYNMLRSAKVNKI